MLSVRPASQLLVLGPHSGLLAARLCSRQMREQCKQTAKRNPRDRRMSTDSREASSLAAASLSGGNAPVAPPSFTRRENFKRATVDVGALLANATTPLSVLAAASGSTADPMAPAAAAAPPPLKVTAASIGFDELNIPLPPQSPLPELQFSVWELSEAAALLYPLFISNHTFYVITFNVEEPFLPALDAYLQRLQACASVYELLLVGLYTDASFGAVAVQQGVAGMLSKRYETRFPAVRRVFFMALDSGDGLEHVVGWLAGQVGLCFHCCSTHTRTHQGEPMFNC